MKAGPEFEFYVFDHVSFETKPNKTGFVYFIISCLALIGCTGISDKIPAYGKSTPSC